MTSSSTHSATVLLPLNGPGDPAKFPQTPMVPQRTDWPKREWHHAAFVYGGSMCKLYVDGKEVDSLPRQGPIGILNGRVFAIGGAGGAIHLYKGVVDAIRYYSRPLAASEIKGIVTAVEPVSRLTSTWGSIKAKTKLL